jgi:hypothetical protein
MSATFGAFPAQTWPPPPNYLPRKRTSASSQFSVILCPNVVVPIGGTLAASPSGTGELTLSNIVVSRNVATFTAAGGVPGRVYTLNFLTFDEFGDVFQTLAFLPMSYELGVDPPPVPPTAGFGIALTWGTVVAQFTPTAPAGALSLASAGVGQMLVPNVINGGIIHNPLLAADQNVGIAESIWVNITSTTASPGGGTTSIEVPPGGSFPLFGLTTPVSWAALTAGHNINAVVW